MVSEQQYWSARDRLLTNASICPENRELFRQFFEFEEHKLKRRNQLAELDAGCRKTLYGYVSKLRNVNTWFSNKPWKELTREDIERVWNALEDGTIKNNRGKRFADRLSYYNKIFKSKPFRMVGKSELAKEVIEFTAPQKTDVRFVTEETFRRMVSVVSKPTHLLLLWLAWDIGENIGSLLQLTRQDFTRRLNRFTREPEYLVNLRDQNIKRSRQPRGEPTLYPETVQYADIVLAKVKNDQPLFPFGHRYAQKVIRAIATRANAKCEPSNTPVRWKDLRSGMACHLLSIGWSREEVDARLGHTPNSQALNAYINFLAIDRSKPKKRMHESSVAELQAIVHDLRHELNLACGRAESAQTQTMHLMAELEHAKTEIQSIREMLEHRLLAPGA